MSEIPRNQTPERIQELLETTNRLLERARKAEAELANPTPKVWSPPPEHERPEGFECLVWHRERWRHVKWVPNLRLWLFGYGSAGIEDLGRMFAPLPWNHPPGTDFWDGQSS
jgi:hypothetical protein